MRHLLDLRVNGERLRNAMEKMADIGATPVGGVHRLALSAEDKEARDLFIAWLEKQPEGEAALSRQKKV